MTILLSQTYHQSIQRCGYICLESKRLVHFPGKPINQKFSSILPNVLLHRFLKQTHSNLHRYDFSLLNKFFDQGAILTSLSLLLSTQQIPCTQVNEIPILDKLSALRALPCP